MTTRKVIPRKPSAPKVTKDTFLITTGKKFPPVTVQAILDLQTYFGGRNTLCGILLHAASTPDHERLVKVLTDPTYETLTIPDLLCRAHFTANQFFAAVRDGQKAKALFDQARGHAVGMGIVADAAPGVTKDVVRRAQPYAHLCDTCHGSKTVSQKVKGKKGEADRVIDVPCDECRGTGYVPREADEAAVDQVLNVLGLVAKGGISLNNTQQTLVAPMGIGGTLTELVRFTDRVLYGDVEAVVEGTGEGTET